jgi:hypothetical protein
MDYQVLRDINLNDIIDNIIKIPSKMENISLSELFNKSEYCNYYDYITENEIKNYLSKNNNYIKS